MPREDAVVRDTYVLSFPYAHLLDMSGLSVDGAQTSHMCFRNGSFRSPMVQKRNS
jgi:hypothetical protein